MSVLLLKQEDRLSQIYLSCPLVSAGAILASSFCQVKATLWRLKYEITNEAGSIKNKKKKMKKFQKAKNPKKPRSAKYPKYKDQKPKLKKVQQKTNYYPVKKQGTKN